MNHLPVKLYIYSVGMLLGACLSFAGMWFLLATDPGPGAPPVAYLLLFFSVPVGAVAGAVVVGIAHVWLACFRLLRGLTGSRETARLTLAARCASCGRPATIPERAVSGLCAGCGSPLYAGYGELR